MASYQSLIVDVKFLLPGGDLYGKLKEQRGIPLEERQVVEWFVQIAMALQVQLLYCAIILLLCGYKSHYSSLTSFFLHLVHA